MREQVEWFNTVIVGGGPAGIAPLLAAHRNGDLDELLDRGVAVIERSHRLGGGAIGQYAINSDSSGRTFVDCLLSDSETETELTRLTEHPLTRQLAGAGDGAVALRDAGQFLDLVGAAMARIVAEHKASAVLTGHTAVSATRTADGWSVAIRDLATGAERTLLARHVVLATGAEQPAKRLAAERVGGIDLMQRCAGRLVQSGDVLTTGWLDTITALLADKPEPRVVIVGGSTSAAAVAHALLHRLPGVRFGDGGVTLMHRRPLRVYYPDRASALAEGYTEWSEDDVCPISGKVFRFAGFRLDSRELVMQVRGIGGRAPEPRLQLHQLAAADLDTDAERLLDAADLVIAAFGYRPRALPLFDRAGQPLTLLSQTGPQQPMVDGQCRVLDAAGAPLPDVFGIGLGAGFLPRGRLGGEASFRGQANGLWLWQHDVGALIVDAALKPSDAVAPQWAAARLPAGFAAAPALSPSLAVGGA